MKELKIVSLSLLLFGSAYAQDSETAKKAIDAEQYHKAKTILKSLVTSTPDEGKNYFLLGDVYLRQQETDSAALYFNKGKAVKNNANFNMIGLGHIDLNNGDAAAAQSKFDGVKNELKKKDVEQLIYIGRAYVDADTPDYNKAIAAFNEAIARDKNAAQAYLGLGDAYYGLRKANEAYSNYRTAFDLDKSLLRAKLQVGVITKNTRAAFPEAISKFDEILKLDPNYGPAYRELAETYNLWANTDTAKYKENMVKALDYYKKYMSLTDYSLNSRMRYADFLLLAGDYKALEAETQAMLKMDKVNPRVLRYLAYSSYENGNYDASLKAMTEFMAKAEPKRIIARDHLYLGLAKLASVVKTDDKDNVVITNQALFDEAIGNIKAAAEKDIKITNEFNAIGKKLFAQKLYAPAAVVFEVATTNPDNRNAFYDNFYLAYSIYYDHVNKSAEARKANGAQLAKAETALAKVIELSPTAQDAYLYRARINKQMQSNESLKVMAEAYDKYIEIVNGKGAAEIAKQKDNLIGAYSDAGAYYAVTDKVKAKEYFNKALQLDPNDAYAKSELNKLSK